MSGVKGNVLKSRERVYHVDGYCREGDYRVCGGGGCFVI